MQPIKFPIPVHLLAVLLVSSGCTDEVAERGNSQKFTQQDSSAGISAELPKAISVTTPKIHHLSKQIEQEPSNAQALHDRGFCYAMVGECRAAIADFDEALELDPKSATIRWSYGWALFNLGIYSSALEQWQISISMQDQRPWWAAHTLALGFWTTGNRAEALHQYDAAARENPDKFAEWSALQKYTARWTWIEKQHVYQIFDAWNRAYK